MKREDQLRVVEALVLAASEPLPAAQIAAIVPRLQTKDVRGLIETLNAEYEAGGHAFEIWEVAGGFQFRTRAFYSPYVQQLHDQRPARLSRAALETLAIVAYRQPATRAEIEHVRGVDAGPILRSLLERHLVRVAGHREVPGRPILYGTTRRFLELFGLSRIEDLPTLRELEELVTSLPEEDASEDGEEPEVRALEPVEAEEGEAPEPH